MGIELVGIEQVVIHAATTGVQCLMGHSPIKSAGLHYCIPDKKIENSNKSRILFEHEPLRN